MSLVPSFSPTTTMMPSPSVPHHSISDDTDSFDGDDASLGRSPAAVFLESKLVALGGVDAPSQAITPYPNDRGIRMQQVSAKALAQEVGPDSPIDPLLHALEDSDYRVRQAAIEAMAKVLASLATVANGDRGSEGGDCVAEEARVAVARVAAAAESAISACCLNDKDQRVRHVAIVALGKVTRIGSKEVVKTFGQCLEDTDKRVRRVAVIALGKAAAEGDQVAFDIVVERLNAIDQRLKGSLEFKHGDWKEQSEEASVLRETLLAVQFAQPQRLWFSRRQEEGFFSSILSKVIAAMACGTRSDNALVLR